MIKDIKTIQNNCSNLEFKFGTKLYYDVWMVCSYHIRLHYYVITHKKSRLKLNGVQKPDAYHFYFDPDNAFLKIPRIRTSFLIRMSLFTFVIARSMYKTVANLEQFATKIIFISNWRINWLYFYVCKKLYFRNLLFTKCVLVDR